MSLIKPEKIIFPTQKINTKFQVEGLFAIPEQWKTTDQANPGLFTYVVRMSKFQITKGKIFPRQLTQRQKRQLQQKNKKGGKKQSKNPQPNLQQQRIKKQQQQKQKARQQLFSKLSPEQQFYYNAQDVYKAPSLKFQNNTSQFEFVGKNCLIFQQRIVKDKGEWIYAYKMPAVSQDELAKMRKTKPKTLNNINDLNPVLMRAWLSFEQLSQSSQQKQLKSIRCKLVQVDQVGDSPTPNLQNTYIKLNVTLSQPIIKPKDEFTSLSLIPDPIKPAQSIPQQKCIQQLLSQLSIAIQSLAMQYSAMFWKQINMQQQQRNSSIFLNNKKGQSTKRKEEFLYDFNVTGKYKIFKDRVKKCIVKICETKYKQMFKGMKTFNGIKCNNQDQIYSQIYNMLVTSYQQTLFKIIQQKKQNLNQVLVLNNSTLKSTTQHILSSYKHQSISQRVQRITYQYQLLMNYSQGQKSIKKYIQQYPHVIELKYIYGIYCLKYNLKSTKDVLPFIQEYLTSEKYQLTEDKKIQYMLILFNIGEQASVKGWVLLREVIENQIKYKQNVQNVQNTQEHKEQHLNKQSKLSRWLLLASIVLKSLNKPELSQKYLSYAVRQYQQQKLSKQSQSPSSNQLKNHKQTPSKSQLPTISSVVNYGSQQPKQKLTIMYSQLIDYLSGFSTFQLIKKVMQQKSPESLNVNTNNSQENKQDKVLSFDQSLPELNQLVVSNSVNGIQKLIQIATKLYQKSTGNQKNKSLEFIIKGLLLKLLKTNQQQSINKQQLLNQLQTYLKKSLMSISDPTSRFITLLRLGYLYCFKKQYGNSRACLLKYLQKAQQTPNNISGLSYKILGIACLYSNRIQQSIQTFKHWNLCDCKKYQPWLYLAYAYSKLNNFILVRQCLSQYQKRASQNIEQNEKIILQQIKKQLNQNEQNLSQYDGTIKDKILQTLA